MPKLCSECKIRETPRNSLTCPFCSSLIKHREKSGQYPWEKRIITASKYTQSEAFKLLLDTYKSGAIGLLNPNDFDNSIISKTKILSALKVHVGCQKCGFRSQYPAVYDFHHKTKKTKNSVSLSTKVTTMTPWKIIIAELTRCVILCANCHRIAHSKKKVEFEE